MGRLEATLDNAKEPWLKRAFKAEWPTMGNHLVSAGIATAAATGFAYVAPEFLDSDAAISGATTAVDVLSYWGTFLPQVAFRDRNEMKDSEGNFDKKKVTKKLGEYAGFVGATEVIYATVRSATQYFMQKNGWDPASATLAIQLGATAFFTGAFPPMRYAMSQLSNMKSNEGAIENE